MSFLIASIKQSKFSSDSELPRHVNTDLLYRYMCTLNIQPSCSINILMFDKQKSVCAIQSLLISFFYSKNEAFVPVNIVCCVYTTTYSSSAGTAHLTLPPPTPTSI